MKHIWLIFFLCSGLWSTGFGQKYVQLERSGTLNTIRFSEGDRITFKLQNDDKGWYERMVTFIDVPRNRIVFGDVPVHIDSIAAVRLQRGAASKIIGTALQAGGVNLILFTGYYAIFLAEEEVGIEWKSMVSGVASIALGTAIKRLFRYKTFRISDRKRIRLMDLYFQTPPNTTP